MKTQLRMPFLMFLTMILAAFLAASPSHADGLIVSLSPLSDVPAGSTGNTFDVLLSNTSGASVSVAAFFFEVTSSSSDITFTDATVDTSDPYIFGADSLFGPDIIGSGSTATDINASDLDLDFDGFALDPGVTVGLGHVSFDVASGAPTQTVTFSLAGFPGTSLADAAGNDIPIGTLVGGQFQIIGGVTPAPEPSSLLLLISAVPFAFLRRRSR
ncbi:MAG TPA: PEP-CTERM sorting domain-containing protein [Candidatus Limnocylindrales bacterium]|nr:PEP-CTERM sorting domain-containing protein [Candidatus Limnocylindrales bacterium]